MAVARTGRSIGQRVGQRVDYVGLAGLGVLAVSVNFQLQELARVASFPGYGANLAIYAAATAACIPLQLWLMSCGLRGVPPPHGVLTLCLLAGIHYLAAVSTFGWSWNLAQLAVCALIVVPGRQGTVLYLLVLASVGLLAKDERGITTVYLILAVLWRSITLFALIWLVATIRQLELARREIRDRALVEQRTTTDEQLRRSLGSALDAIEAMAATASLKAKPDPADAQQSIRALADESRHALAEARRLTRQFSTPSVAGLLEASRALLAAAGVEATVALDKPLSSEDATEDSLESIQSIVRQGLRDPALRSCVIEVTHDRGDRLSVRLRSTAEAGPDSGAR
jgi:hypothetical protein